MKQTPNERQEEEEEVLTPEEEAELEGRLADYMTDGKIDWNKVDAAVKPVDLNELIANEQKRNDDT